ncbi:hypothetical protein N7474_001585, partial [Penicillium riverlandense]|uniref:uncharacterized protein n=1 Tax=Penicillium riverlandense TaxID=1903569 RepID=UPI0025477D0A
KVVVLLTDIFGIFTNSLVLADGSAYNCYLTVIPDLFQDDQMKLSDRQNGKPAIVDPIVESTIQYVRDTFGVKKIGAVGYCFGGKIDSIFTTKLLHESEEILVKIGQVWQINLFGSVSHGFAVRADLSNTKQKWTEKGASYQAVIWLDQYL